MFGYVMPNTAELSKPQRKRYLSVYCGICRRLRENYRNPTRLVLSYDMAFLALLLMSLYEPREKTGKKACRLHPIRPRPWVDNAFISYGADMNVALAYHKALDDRDDEKKPGTAYLLKLLEPCQHIVMRKYPRQYRAIETCIFELRSLEESGCANPDEPANCFGKLMGELFVYREDMWSDTLRQMGMALGRYIYLADAAVDYRRDLKKDCYNPFAVMGTGEDRKGWEEYLVLAMGRCTRYYERLPLVQDKAILDNILYSGIWLQYRRKQGKQKASREEIHD